MKKFIYLLTILGTLGLVSCNDKILEDKPGNMMLRVDVQGVSEALDIESNSAPRSATVRNTSSTVPSNTNGFHVDFSISQDAIVPNSEFTSSANSQNDYKQRASTINRATQPMQTGYTYRILLYNKNTGQLWKTEQGTSGTALSIEGQTGESYLWYAYSYNNDDMLPEPANIANPSVETSIVKDFLYATGEINIPANSEIDYNLPITFDHKVTQIRVKIDATVLARFARIDNLNASFDNNSYIKKGLFSIRDNQTTNIEVVPTETIFNASSSNDTWEANYYTIDPSAVSSYKIIINDLPVKFDGVSEDISERNLATYFGSANKPTFTSNFAAPVVGQRLSTTLRLNYQVAPLRILHISNNTSYGYALQQGPSWDFLNSKVNFGDLPESIVKMGVWAPGQGSWSGGNQTDNKSQNWIQFAATTAFDNQLASRLAATNTTNRPDIVILGYNMTSVRPVVAQALNSYLNDKGVVIMLLQDAANAYTQSFFNTMFGVSNIGTNSSGSSGAMYPIEGVDPDDEILNGPFGDVRGRHWGEDAGTTLGITNLPLSAVTVYSYGNAINRSSVATRVTMFKHNTKSFFYIGDGGFVSYNGGNSNTICPFNYDPVAKKPLPKSYGNAGSGYSAGSLGAYNSIVMANVMAWAVEKAELEGVRTWKYAGPPTP
ncbi:hypothetical protein [Sphingobacterium chungjuense]|uniref:hypothetical protein n=1 Tax=Sphingobacterium chungjuense TaxID=2675553 RepID=UPI00140C08F3|nr:hypothetical protein [Sphingobacterium chungjuense]